MGPQGFSFAIVTPAPHYWQFTVNADAKPEEKIMIPMEYNGSYATFNFVVVDKAATTVDLQQWALTCPTARPSKICNAIICLLLSCTFKLSFLSLCKIDSNMKKLKHADYSSFYTTIIVFGLGNVQQYYLTKCSLPPSIYVD